MQVSKNTLCQEKERPRDESRKMEGRKGIGIVEE